MSKKLTEDERKLRNEKRREKAAAKKAATEEAKKDCTSCKDPKTERTITFTITRTCWLNVDGRNAVLKLKRGELYTTEDINEINVLDATFKRR